MLRSKEKFYWTDALYLARAKDMLILRETLPDGQIYQCRICSSFVKYVKKDNTGLSGSWQRVKPFEQFQWAKKYSDVVLQIDSLKAVPAPERRKLYQCGPCASHWWNDESGWNKADDEVLDSQEAQRSS